MAKTVLLTGASGFLAQQLILDLPEQCRLKHFARVLRDAYPDRASNIPHRRLPDVVVRLLGLFVGNMKTIAMALGKRRFSSSEKVRKLPGRDPIPGDQAIRAGAETLIGYGAV